MSTQKVTPEYLNSCILEEEFIHRGTLTICILYLRNGGAVIGDSNIVPTTVYNLEMGNKTARDKAINKLWELEGYSVRKAIFTEQEDLRSLVEATQVG